VTILAGARVVTPGGVSDRGWLRYEGERIVAVGGGEPPHPADVVLAGGAVVPGFVDVHVHGGGGASFTGEGADEAARAVDFHRRHGTTTMLASLVTATLPELERQMNVLAGVAARGLIAGVHLEGPFLARPRCGAHAVELLRPPERGDVDRLLAAGRGAVRMVTLAPELEGGLEAVRRLARAGVLPAVGHTDATYEVARAAVDAGARVATHLFNAMPPAHHREPGPVVALLERPEVVLELINDGVHLHPAVVRGVVAAAGAQRVALVTDAMAAAGAGDGVYALGPSTVHVRDGVARVSGGTALAGSMLTMDAAFRRAVRDAGVPLDAAARAAATTPAALLGLRDVGALEPGRRADLVVLDDAFAVRAVLHRGRWVDDRSPPFEG
jgi:N-acetylglucosamine-6-phosphate deacetylase